MADDDLLLGKVREVLRKHFDEASDYDLSIEAVRIALPLKIGSKAEYTRQWKAMISGEIKNIRRLQALPSKQPKLLMNFTLRLRSRSLMRGRLSIAMRATTKST